MVTWQSKKQSVVTRRNVEAEFRALAQTICEGMWLKRLLAELKVKIDGIVSVFCDNLTAINIAKNLVHHDRTKHVKLDRHFIKEIVEEKLLELVYTPTNLQVADIFTKALPRVKFKDFISKLGMIDIYSPA